jgi:phosphoglucosamine mutase
MSENFDLIDNEEAPTSYSTSSPAPATNRPAIKAPGAGTGRRKEAVARVRLVPGTGRWVVNGKTLENYFPNKVHQQLVSEPFRTVGAENQYDVFARINGGGVSGQAGALRLGVARSLNQIDEEANRPALKKAGFFHVMHVLLSARSTALRRHVSVLNTQSVNSLLSKGVPMALFGTDGIRGLANRDLTAELALDVSVAAAHILVESSSNKDHQPTAIVGQDSRASGEFLEAAVVAGLTSAGINVYRVGVLPTPAIAHLVAEMKCDLGVMISASHNPMPDNGIKLFARGGGKLDDAIEARIEARMGEAWERPTGRNVGRVINDDAVTEKYLSHLLSSVETPLKGLKIVIDCANGASSYVAPEVYRRAGAEVIAIFNQPDGWNINDDCGSTHLHQLRSAVLKEGADLGIAHDGDADRCLAIDAAGNEIDGDHILTILARGFKARGVLKSDTVVGTVMSNLGFMHAMKDAAINVVTTPVGDRYVLENMIANDYSLGGEQSGHVIMRQLANTGDGLLTALQLMQEVVRTGKTLQELAATMVRFPQVLINVKNVAKDNLPGNATIAAAVKRAEDRLGDSGRVLLRASGTEPLVRVMVEAASDSLAQEVAQDLADVVQAELSISTN